MYEAIILAGGFGTRLREAVPDLPKPMAPVAGRPFLAWQLDYLIKAGVGRFILSVGYKAESIKHFFGSSYQGTSIVYAEESEPLGTGGAIQLALTLATEKRVFVFNGDTLCEADLHKLRMKTEAQSNAVGIFVMQVIDAARYGSISFDAGTGLVNRFGEKSVQGPGYINAGIYDLPASLFADTKISPPFSFETGVLQSLVNKNLFAVEAGNFFIDIGIPDDFNRAQYDIPAALCEKHD